MVFMFVGTIGIKGSREITAQVRKCHSHFFFFCLVALIQTNHFLRHTLPLCMSLILPSQADHCFYIAAPILVQQMKSVLNITEFSAVLKTERENLERNERITKLKFYYFIDRSGKIQSCIKTFWNINKHFEHTRWSFIKFASFYDVLLLNIHF